MKKSLNVVCKTFFVPERWPAGEAGRCKRHAARGSLHGFDFGFDESDLVVCQTIFRI